MSCDEINKFDSLSYIFDPIKYEHQKTCMHELGLVGGTNVSEISGNRVDLESDLRGQTRKSSNCSNTKFLSGEPIKIISNETNKERTINTELNHLPHCQFIKYETVPTPIGLVKPKCNLPPRINK